VAKLVKIETIQNKSVLINLDNIVDVCFNNKYAYIRCTNTFDIYVTELTYSQFLRACEQAWDSNTKM
jgi:hypothetical protein